MSETANPTVNDMMAAYALDAVDHARSAFAVELDFSPASIQRVEAILAKLHSSIPRGLLRLLKRGPSEDTVDQICKMYGGYIGEVFRRQRGGTWQFDQEVLPGHLVIALMNGDSRIFPPSKVRKRLENGSEDNVWSYFRVLIDESSPVSSQQQ
jgi:hypothetical protein